MRDRPTVILVYIQCISPHAGLIYRYMHAFINPTILCSLSPIPFSLVQTMMDLNVIFHVGVAIPYKCENCICLSFVLFYLYLHFGVLDLVTSCYCWTKSQFKIRPVEYLKQQRKQQRFQGYTKDYNFLFGIQTKQLCTLIFKYSYLILKEVRIPEKLSRAATNHSGCWPYPPLSSRDSDNLRMCNILFTVIT